MTSARPELKNGNKVNDQREKKKHKKTKESSVLDTA